MSEINKNKEDISSSNIINENSQSQINTTVLLFQILVEERKMLFHQLILLVPLPLKLPSHQMVDYLEYNIINLSFTLKLILLNTLFKYSCSSTKISFPNIKHIEVFTNSKDETDVQKITIKVVTSILEIPMFTINSTTTSDVAQFSQKIEHPCLNKQKLPNYTNKMINFFAYKIIIALVRKILYV
ncbi:hypothetical protein AGLY_014908 [Aphis glycines]|uniref:Uncharacterized protein n=1 Tax=Aphis glycines TaxID=307491 RepID=A0A6G0T371_APHGL|nr:hypothetical protein AGLY_014908 [Aphis glycines]